MDVLFYWLIGALILLAAAVCFFAVLLHNARRKLRQMSGHIAELERAHELESALLNAVFDSIPDVLFCKDLDSRHIRMNKSFETLFDFKREELIGKTELELMRVSEETFSEWRRWDLKVINSRKPIEIEEAAMDASGNMRMLNTLKIPLMQNGEVFGVLGLARDITERREFEEQLRAASHAKSAFIANMSHELRTPMNSIVGFSELALESEADPRTRTYLQRIVDNSHWLLQIINDILDISKIEADKMELVPVPFDPSELFAQCQTNVAPKAIEKDIGLIFYIEPFSDGKYLVGDPVRLRQILINIVSNAIKFTDSGIVRITADVTAETEDSKTIYFEVKDTGIGMTPEQIEHIFEPFVQGDSGITRKYGGTGLGLSIVKNLLDMMGGKLDIKSTPGAGSIFSFTLTFPTVEAILKMPERHALLDVAEKPYFEGEVLVFEDNLMNQMVIKEHLSRVGLNCVIAENGTVGVEMVRSRAKAGQPPFDLILMDIHMPVMDGLEAAEKIIALELEMDISTPIVAMTANVMTNDREIYRQRGMEHCIGKPFTSQELWEGLLKYMKPKGWMNRSDVAQSGDNEDSQSSLQLQDKLLALFVRDNQNRFAQIVDCIKQGDIRQAHRLTHTIKSSAGLINKVRLQEAAGDVEHLLSDGEDNTTDIHMLKLRTELKQVLDELEPMVKWDALGSRTKSSDIFAPEKRRELAQQLEPLLKSRSTESLNLLDDIRAIPGTQALAEQIESFDFKLALQTLLELMKEWEV